MKTTVALVCFLATASAFQAPTFATRAVGTRAVAKKAPAKVVAVAQKAPAKKVVAVAKKAPAKKVVAVAKKAPAKKVVAAVAKKAPAKKVVVVAKKAPAKVVTKPTLKNIAVKAPPVSKGYPSFRDKAESFRIGRISGGGNKAPPVYFPVPDFSNPAKNIKRDPSFYAEAAKKRLTQNKIFVIDDGLTELERRQRSGATATFLTGSAKSQADKSAIRGDIEVSELPFGLSADRFQLLFITIFGLFTLVGSLSGSLKL